MKTWITAALVLAMASAGNGCIAAAEEEGEEEARDGESEQLDEITEGMCAGGVLGGCFWTNTWTERCYYTCTSTDTTKQYTYCVDRMTVFKSGFGWITEYASCGG